MGGDVQGLEMLCCFFGAPLKLPKFFNLLS